MYANASITGVALRVNWQDVEPSANQFNWQMIDDVFTQAAASHKFVVLCLVPGFETPSWALQGVATATFARQYGPRVGEMEDLPMPWDQTYLSRWFAFLQAVADRYGSNPGFRMISADGPTSVSEEMTLPRTASDIARWISLGYTPDKYMSAWGTVFQEYAQIFPRQYISLSLGHGLPVGNNGTRDNSQDRATPQSIIAEGLQYKDRFVLQENALRDYGYDTWGYGLVSSNSGNVVTGFEVGAVNQGDIADPVQALSAALQNGLAAHVDFLEVYTFDVVNPAMQGVLQATQAQLPH